MNGDHGQIVLLHVVKEFKQEPEHVRMMLRTLASHSLSRRIATFQQLIGGHGQAVQKPAIVVFRQEQGRVLTIKEALPMNQKLTNNLAILNYVHVRTIFTQTNKPLKPKAFFIFISKSW